MERTRARASEMERICYLRSNIIIYNVFSLFAADNSLFIAYGILQTQPQTTPIEISAYLTI